MWRESVEGVWKESEDGECGGRVWRESVEGECGGRVRESVEGE